ncbi:hypothetical protein F5144DRAFT_123538 [Chaetomium tenue]|uniref:Uncharacterized protein n=1 Tax=Chaetomium tenue TaxID=1854479 RepID=A0ACB7PH26_9PEZI|nr:hypothetical protein F5144DRAFT_123538 [Chaetomium globosum]
MSTVASSSPARHKSAVVAVRPPRLALNDMPTEIVAAILGLLHVPGPHCYYRDLQTTCLVSRRLSDISRPLLYHTVLLRDAKSLYHLFWTLCRRPEYGCWARWFACNFFLENADRTIHNLLVSDNETVRHFLGQVSILRPYYRPDEPLFNEVLGEYAPSPAAVRGIPDVLFGLVLRSLTQVETLELWPLCGPGEALYEIIRATQHIPREEPGVAPFQQIRVLYAHGDGIHPRDKDNFFAPDDLSVTADDWGPLLALFHLETAFCGKRLLLAHLTDEQEEKDVAEPRSKRRKVASTSDGPGSVLKSSSGCASLSPICAIIPISQPTTFTATCNCSPRSS